MANVIAVIILAILVGSASAYIIKAKKKGVKCIGCPAAGNCPGHAGFSQKKQAGGKHADPSGMCCACRAAETEEVKAELNQ